MFLQSIMISSSCRSFQVVALLSTLILCLLVSSMAHPKLRVGYYGSTCPSAESIVRKVVNKEVSKNPGTAAGLIRLHFHDCFVRGCDASVLLNPIPGVQSERDHPANNGSLRGFDVVNKAKAQVEAMCPQTVSCADILAFAARDSAYEVGKIWYEVPAGRRDGRVSLFNEVTQNLPPPFFNATQLRDNFARKGMSLDEMVTLSGAHSIGVSHCSSFSSRLYPRQDPSMDRNYAAYLKTICPRPVGGVGGSDPTVPLDFVTPNRLDNRYYMAVKGRRGILSSDQTLMSSPLTSRMVLNNAKYGRVWAAKFAAAMVHMGNLDVLTGSQGEIRKRCQFVN